jgi:hypothetical protein
MTDLTPLVERQKALREQLALSTLALVGVSVGIASFLGFTMKSGMTMVFLFGGWGQFIRGSWRKYQAARSELRDATVSLETERARLRGSGERRDAAQGLAVSEEATGGELSIGQDGELSEER